MNKNLGPKIIELRSQGKSYNEIVKILNCSKSTVCFHCGEGQKNKNKLRGSKDPLKKKLNAFQRKSNTSTVGPKKLLSAKRLLYKKLIKFSKGGKIMQQFTVEDVMNKFNIKDMKTYCYITGDEIDLTKPRTYHFDHIIPTSRGGDNSLDNLGITTNLANLAKSNMTYDELLIFCKKVIENNKT